MRKPMLIPYSEPLMPVLIDQAVAAFRDLMLAALGQSCDGQITCVMVGGDDGITSDARLPVRLGPGWRTLLIEPHPEAHARTLAQHSGANHVQSINSAVAGTAQAKTVYFLNSAGAGKYTAPLDRRVFGARPDIDNATDAAAAGRAFDAVPEDVTQAEVEARPLSDVLETHGFSDPDVLVIDGLSHDPNDFIATDLESMAPKLVVLCNKYDHPIDMYAATATLERAGYDTYRIGHDVVAVNRTGFVITAATAAQNLGYVEPNPSVEGPIPLETGHAIARGPIAIPRTLAHIWVGNRPPPTEWMQSWRDLHPDWSYELYDNELLLSRRWRSQALIKEYFRREDYSGVSDLIRYELLLERGGVIPEADSICLRPVDDLFPKPTLYACYECQQFKPRYLSPFIASAPGHPILEEVIHVLNTRLRPETLEMPWVSTGNKFLGDRMAGRDLDLVVFPSHFFNPNYKGRLPYMGDEQPYADQKWGSTLRGYGRYDNETEEKIYTEVLRDL